MSRRVASRASFTAESCAARRAAETMRPPGRRLLDDPYSRLFVRDPFLRACLINPVGARAFIGLLNYVYGAAGQVFTVLRVRFVDEIRRAAIQAGIDQVVLLGAGYDTTILRAELDAAVKIFEVDAPATQAVKRLIVQRVQQTYRSSDLVWVPCDFERDSLRESLLTNGFDPMRRSLVVWIGVTSYLSESAIDATLADLQAVCATGSMVVFDYINRQVAASNRRPAGIRRWARDRGSAKRRGEPFRTSFSALDADAKLSSHGFQRGEHLRTADLLRRYAPTQAHTTRSQRSADNHHSATDLSRALGRTRHRRHPRGPRPLYRLTHRNHRVRQQRRPRRHTADYVLGTRHRAAARSLVSCAAQTSSTRY